VGPALARGAAAFTGAAALFEDLDRAAPPLREASLNAKR
jgi:hypothetical protein